MMGIINNNRSICFGALLGLAVGCWRVDSEHCGSNFGDASCMDGMFCNGCEPDNNGCVTERPSDECHVEAWPMDTGESSGAEAVDSSTGTMPASTTIVDTLDESGSAASSVGSTTEALQCDGNEDCTDPAAPFCDLASRECITCSATVDPDGACAGLDPGAPLCANGACVQCTAASYAVCDEQLLSCDESTNACVSCVEHAECSSGACELAVGRCFPLGDVVHVDGDGGQDFPSITAAVASVGAGEHRVIVVHALDGGLPYLGSVLIDGGKTIALLAAPGGESMSIQGSGGNPGLTVQSVGTLLYLDGLDIANTSGLGLRVSDAFCWVDRSRIAQNSSGAIVAQAGAELVLRNSFVGGTIDTAVLDIQGSTANVLYTTLGGSLGATTSILCDMAGTATVRNSFVVSRSAEDEIACADLEVSYSAAEMMLEGTGNMALGNMDVDWFQDVNSGDFHILNAPFSLATTAQWELGDPPTDIDGNARPNTDGTADVAGADRP